MEVKVINKQKFLAELGRLLTFMYEEDRQAALAMYSKMFDDALEEQALLQFLVSPTRQAVVLARSYDAQERKLQVHTQSREGNYDYNGQVPQFVLAIDDLRQKAAAAGLFAPVEEAPVPAENQFSLFDESTQSSESPESQSAVYAEPVVEEVSPAVPVVEEVAEAAEQDTTEESSGDVEEFASAVSAFLADMEMKRNADTADEVDPDLVLPVRVTVKKFEDEAPLELPHNDNVEPAQLEELYEEAVEEEAEEVAEEAVEAPELEDVAQAAQEVVEEVPEKETHKVSVKDLHKHPKTEADNGEAAAVAVPDTVTVKPVKSVSKKDDGLDSVESESVGTAAKPRKANVPLLILFIILAIIPTLIGVALLLIPTALCLTLAVAFVSGGVLVLTAAFGGFTIFADLMIVLGLAIILLALGLLFTWMFIWFIGGAIVGFIRWVCHLGGKLCFKEVAAQ